jgi:hypothetical protein
MKLRQRASDWPWLYQWLRRHESMARTIWPALFVHEIVLGHKCPNRWEKLLLRISAEARRNFIEQLQPELTPELYLVFGDDNGDSDRAHQQPMHVS